MTIPQPIQEVFDDLIAQFATKNKEYQGNTQDLFRNFNQGAALSSETPEQVLLGYVNKQIVSLYDAKNHHPERLQDAKFVNEKAGDISVYMVLLMAMVRSKAIAVPTMHATYQSTGEEVEAIRRKLQEATRWES